MGGGASIQEELKKPPDASDCNDYVSEVKRLRLLIQQRGTIEVQSDIPKVTFLAEKLRKSAAQNDLASVKAHIAAACKDTSKLDESNEDLETALHLSAQNGYSSIVQCLLEAGSSTDKKDDYGFTPFRHIAGAPASKLTDGHIECAKLLCAAKADCNVVCDYGWTPLMKACEMGHLDLVKIFCEKSNVNINMKENGGETALDKASTKEFNEIIEYLLSQGAIESSQD